MPFQKIRRKVDKKYLEFVKGLPCIVSMMESEGRMNTEHSLSEYHHVNKRGYSTMAGKCDDLRCVPLTNKFHREIHLIGRESFERKYNIDLEYVIKHLNRIWSDMNATRMDNV